MESDYNDGEGSWILEIPSKYLTKDIPAYVDEREENTRDSLELTEATRKAENLKSRGKRLKRKRDADVQKIERALKKSCQFIHKELLEAKYHYNRSIKEMEAHAKVVSEMQKLIRSYSDGSA